MSIEIKAPQLPESVPDGTIASWYKKPGEAVKRDELLVDIETDKVVIEVVSPSDGVLEKILKDSGDVIVSHEVIAVVKAGAVADQPATDDKPQAAEDDKPATDSAASTSQPDSGAEPVLSPAARKLADENNVNVANLTGTGKDG